MLGITICYDVEFPLFARRLAEAGASIVLAPSCTDSLAGWNRVRLGARARAMENQFYVVQSPTVGDAPWTEAIDINVGSAGVYGPVDRGFPDDGVIAEGTLNAAQWVFAELDMVALEEARADGQVFNFRDWDAQHHVTGVGG
jgi:predicted amidohydrolase